MAEGLKTETIVVPASWGGRDAGKTFVITEMPAARAEKWAWRLILALKGTSAQIPESLAELGMVAVAIRGVNSFLASDVDFGKLEPLLDEMLGCISVVRDPSAPHVVTALIPDADIMEIKTIGWLRSEVLRLHTNFSIVEALLRWLATLNQASTSTSPDM